ncbi:MAG TPA: diphthine synthase [Thermoplasmata archaeon]|nr:diphthine synthase [Thermoplasmata archaeon]
MAELAFVGLGLSDERGLSERAWEVLRAADEVFAEEYTAVAPAGTLSRIEQRIGRAVRALDRASLESERPILDALGRSGRVALLVVGDPFAATTHVALRVAVERAGHTWQYVPNASILTGAAGFLGLQQYRFGRTVSLPFAEPGFDPRSPLDQIAANRSRGLHTLVLLDLRPSDGRFLTGAEALRRLRRMDPEGSVLPRETEVAVVARVGRDDPAAWFGPLEALAQLDFGAPMHAVVVPAVELHFEESAALARFRVG